MHAFQPLPDLWLLSDERNDAVLETALHSFTGPIGFVYRHYHLAPEERYARFRQLTRIARREGHVVILSDSALTAREWGADGIYGNGGSQLLLELEGDSSGFTTSFDVGLQI